MSTYVHIFDYIQARSLKISNEMENIFYKIEDKNFKNFMEGFSAAVILKNNAAKEGFFIEYVCLSTSIIDALLRIGLVFQFLLNHKHNSLPKKYILQTENGKRISEKGIYNEAKAKAIISNRSMKILLTFMKNAIKLFIDI